MGLELRDVLDCGLSVRAVRLVGVRSDSETESSSLSELPRNSDSVEEVPLVGDTRGNPNGCLRGSTGADFVVSRGG